MIRKKSFKKRSSSRELTDISLTPLIDAVLTLLVIFMVATPTIRHAIKVNLPHSKTGERETTAHSNKSTVYLDKDNQIFFNDMRVSPEELIEQLKLVTTANQQETVFVRADQGVAYGQVVSLVDKVKLSGGVKYVALAIQQST